MEELKNKPITQESLEVPSKTTPTEEDKSYTLPKFSQIFDPLKPKKNNNTSFTQANKEILERVLKDFGIAAKVVEIHIGPAVTEYELTVPPATKVNKIVNIDKEIALALAAKDVIIQAPIPGKSTIGIEIPNPTISSVTLREVLESPQNLKSDAKICAALGKDIMGTPKVFDLTKMPHLLVAGSTGSGKSVCINGIIASILMRYKPSEVKLVLVDPKKVELTNYNGIPHLLCPVVSDPKKASLTLQKVVTEMDNRFQTFSDKEVKNIGTIESMGTAYPIAYDETGIYAASGHDMQRFEIEKSGSLRLAEGIYEQFDESGNAAYTMKKGEETDVITEEEYYAAFEKYSNATIVNFSYGASDAGKAEVVTNNELEPRQGNIAEDVNVLEIVQETASEFAVKKMETSYF